MTVLKLKKRLIRSTEKVYKEQNKIASVVNIREKKSKVPWRAIEFNDTQESHNSKEQLSSKKRAHAPNRYVDEDEEIDLVGIDNPASPTRKKKRRDLFTLDQLEELNKRFHTRKHLSRPEREKLAGSLNLTVKQVTVWFQNNRYKTKKSYKEAISDNRFPKFLDVQTLLAELQSKDRHPNPYWEYGNHVAQHPLGYLPGPYNQLPSYIPMRSYTPPRASYVPPIVCPTPLRTFPRHSGYYNMVPFPS